jgi:hypothetical protein
MEPVTTLIGAALIRLAEHGGRQLINNYFKNRDSQRSGLHYDPKARETLEWDGSDAGCPPSALEWDGRHEGPVTIRGEFLLDRTLYRGLTGDEAVLVLVVEVVPWSEGRVYLFDFDLDGYQIQVWPGEYSLYTLVLDPLSPSLLDAEVLGWGYPYDDGDNLDPNPLRIHGSGLLRLDMGVFYPNEPLYVDDLVLT